MFRDGLWIQTNRGLESISPEFLGEFLKKQIPKLRSSTLRELSTALWDLLNNQSFPSTPFNSNTLALELSHLLGLLGQNEFAQALAFPLSGGTASLFGAFGEAVDGGLFTQMGDNQTPYLIRWDLVHQGLPSFATHRIVLEVPDPRIPGDAFELWLNRAETFLDSHKGEACFFWNPIPAREPSLFHTSTDLPGPTSDELAFAPFLDFLARHSSPRVRVLVSCNQVIEDEKLPSRENYWGCVPEGILVGSMDPDFPGRVSNLSARIEIHLQHLARMRQDPVEWLVREAPQLRNPAGTQSFGSNPLAPSVRWAVRGWLDPRGSGLLEPVWEVLQRLWPARDEIVLAWEKGLPTEPLELERFHENHKILTRLEEIRHPLLWPQPEAWARLRNLGFTGPIWQTGF